MQGSLTGTEPAIVFTSKYGSYQSPTVVDFRIDPEAAEGAVIHYAVSASAEGKASNYASYSEWMPLLLNEVASITLRTGDSLVLASDTDVAYYLFVGGNA